MAISINTHKIRTTFSQPSLFIAQSKNMLVMWRQKTTLYIISKPYSSPLSYLVWSIPRTHARIVRQLARLAHGIGEAHKSLYALAPNDVVYTHSITHLTMVLFVFWLNGCACVYGVCGS